MDDKNHVDGEVETSVSTGVLLLRTFSFPNLDEGTVIRPLFQISLPIWTLAFLAWGTSCPPSAAQQRLGTASAKSSMDWFTEAADYSAKHVGDAVLVMQNGTVLFERYEEGASASKPHMLASGTKSFTGVVAMFAVQDGLLDLDEKVADTITEWKEDPAKSKITIRHLLSLSSGLHPADAAFPNRRQGAGIMGDLLQERQARIARQDEDEGLRELATGNWFKDALRVPMKYEAGTTFDYGPSHFYVFGEVMNRKLAKAPEIPAKSFEAYAHLRLLDPIGLSVAYWGKDSARNVNMPGGMFLTAREWAKFGQFVLQRGAWTNSQGSQVPLLKPELLEQCFEPSKMNRAYGLTWWLSGVGSEADHLGQGAGQKGSLRERVRQRIMENQVDSGLDWNGKPIEVYMAAGLGKQRLFVVPEFQLVVVRFAQASREGMQFANRDFLQPILNGVTHP